MIIKRVINNNIVSSVDTSGREIILMGRGLAYNKKKFDVIDEEKIEKIFRLENYNISEKFMELLNSIPIEHIQVANNIIEYAKKELNKNLNETIYISLLDHIHFAVERYLSGVVIKNAMFWEIKQFYKDETRVALDSLEVINKALNVNLPEDEAGFIALHFVNAELNSNMVEINNITNIIHQVLNIVRYYFKVSLDEDSLNYFRFITHLKFFAQRILKSESLQNDDGFFYDMIKERYANTNKCVERIAEHIKNTYNCEISNDEKVYLIVHIERVIRRE